MRFWICSSCSVLYTKNPLTSESLRQIFNSKDFYASGEPGGDNIDYFDFIGGEKYLRMTAQGRLSRIGKFKPKGTLLEVASAAGFFLVEAKNAGYDVQGIEISEPMAEYATKRWKVPVTGKPVEEVGLPDEHFDVIASWGVMTILKSPVDVIRKFYRALKPRGIWAFNTYYYDCYWHRLWAGRWIALAVQARQVFSQQLLRDLISKEGFNLVSFRRDWPHTDILKIADQFAVNSGMKWVVPLVQKAGIKDMIIKVPLPDVREFIWQKPS